MNRLLQDLRYALRQLRRSPGFALTAILTLVLGIGASSTILSWISATLLNPVPGAAPAGEMVTAMRGDKTQHPSPPLSYPDFIDMRQQNKSFSGMLAYHDDFMSITGRGTPERIYGALASADYFEVLGVRPVLGNTFRFTQPNEHDGAAQAVLSYSLWQNHFAADRAIVGKTIEINLHPYTITGVAPRDFIGCKSGLRTDIWIPLGMDRQMWGSTRIDRRQQSWLNVLGVLRPGVDRHSAENELNVLMQRIVQQYPTSHLGNNAITVDPIWRSPFGANVYLSGTLSILLALALVLLLLACANVANLLLVRSVARRREFAIRMSMGAGRWCLVRQLMLENLLISLAAGGIAIACTTWSSRGLSAFVPNKTLPLALRGGIDGRALLAIIAVSVFTALISGIVPAWRSSHLSPGAVLKEEGLSLSGGLHKSRLASGLVVAQIALSVLLLACAGLFVRSLQKAQSEDPGFDANNVLLATMDLDPLGYSSKTGLEFQKQIVDRIRSVPSVTSVTLADFSPMSFTIHSDGFLPEGYVPQTHENIEADRGSVGPGYLATTRTPLRTGRDFTEQDNATAPPVAIVNQALVDRYWPGQSGIGKRISLRGRWNTIVGVIGNGKYRLVTTHPAPLILLPLAQAYQSEVILHVRTTGRPEYMAHAIEQAIHGLNPNLPLFNVMSMRESMLMGSLFERIAVTFAGSFGVLALLLAAVGIYAVVAYTTRQRTHEIGIRMALGAGKGMIFGKVIRQGLRLTIIGLAVGLAGSMVLTRFVRSLLFGIGNTDLLTFVTVGAVLSVVALLACCLPAWRAASVQPMQALHME